MSRAVALGLMVVSVSLMVGAIASSGVAAPGSARANTGQQVNYVGFRNLTQEVQSYRAGRLVSLEQFQAMAREPHTIILDARSAQAYARGHIDGAVNLSFSDFTAQSLAAVIGNPNTRVLIYCNNNFENDVAPVILKSAPLALNIQTFINLYGYGFKNVYELGDVVNFNDPKVRWVRG